MIENMIRPRVAIIVLNWNHADDTLACLRSVMALSYPAIHSVVVDNGSTDDSVARINSTYPNIEVIQTGENLGYAGGNNLGIRHALAYGCDYVWLLNDDITVAPDSLSALLEVAREAPDIAFLGPKVYMKEEPDRILSAGGPLADGWQPQHIGIGEIDSGQYDTIRDVDYLSGCAVLANACALESIGLLDEDFFAYHEDTEWCYRAKKAGWRVTFVPQARVWHPDTRRRDPASSLVTYYAARNHLLFLRKHQLGWSSILQSLARYAIWIGNWSINPKWKHFRAKRDALCLALLDFARGKTGKCERQL